jgi:hypothetical protein
MALLRVQLLASTGSKMSMLGFDIWKSIVTTKGSSNSAFRVVPRVVSHIAVDRE